jgi:alkylation response protein AidB-like acyl-CoA dehydrogenase
LHRRRRGDGDGARVDLVIFIDCMTDHRYAVIPAKAGIQCLETKVAGSPLSRGRRRDFPVERIWRDVRVCKIYEGASDIQRMVIGRELTGK